MDENHGTARKSPAKSTPETSDAIRMFRNSALMALGSGVVANLFDLVRHAWSIFWAWIERRYG